ncbi:MAG: leucine-rich repeat domain-containing protein [Clostridia bacterium]|nr:leucine-rich repeat domain-containing protein [Clostridia bacterium]
MKKLFKKSLAVIMAVAMLLCAVPFTASAESYSGTHGDNLTWTLDTETGVLEISGTGEMTNWSVVPWDSYHSYIKSVNIGNGVTTISEYAFYNCDSLVSITIPDSVTAIGYYAFYNCDSLARVTFGENSQLQIGQSAFKGCTSLENITLPDNVTSIGENVFANTAYYNNEANWENNALYIGDCLISVKEVASASYSVKAGTRLIAARAFGGCDQIINLTLPGSIKAIGADAFFLNSDGSIIFEEEKIKSFDFNVYFNGDVADWCSIEFGNKYSNPVNSQENIYRNSVDNLYIDGVLVETLTIPEGVTSINTFSFQGIETLTSISFSDSVTNINDYAFEDCTALTSINFSENSRLTSVGYYVFNGCTSLSNITIPDGITEIQNTSFTNTAYYNNDANWENDVLYIGKYLIAAKETISGTYAIKPGTVYIANSAFEYCIELEGVTIPESVTNIGNQAFACSGLSGELVIPANVKYIGHAAFEAIPITKATINAETISADAFHDINKLRSIKLGDNVKKIESGAFGNCYNVLLIEIGKGLREIEYIFADGGIISPFYSCITASYIVDSENEYFYTDEAGAFIDKANGVLIKYPSLSYILDLDSIDWDGFLDSAFDWQRIIEPGYLESMQIDPSTIVPIDYTIPDTVKTISSFAFGYFNNIKNIKFPESITETYTYTFLYYPGIDSYLTEIILPSSVTKIDPAAFVIENLNFIHIPSSVTEIGEEIAYTSAYICSDTEDCYAKTYAEENGYEFVLCDGNHHVHTPGEWETMVEATVENEGHRVQKCTECKQVVASENIPRLQRIRNDESKITADIPGDMYSGNSVELSVEEAENENAFEFVNKLNGRYMAYDIKILVNGEETQPTGKVTVRVPIEGFVFGKYAVYHIDPVTHEREELPCKREGNYIVFETDSFSYFVIADATEYEIQIKQPSVTTVNYGDTLVLHADLGETALPEGYAIEWLVEGTGVNIKPSEDGLTCEVTSIQKGDVTVTARIVDGNGEAITDANGNEIAASQQLKSNVTFWQKIVSFFKNLFGISRMILQYKQ